MSTPLQAARERVRQLERAKRRLRDLDGESAALTRRVQDLAARLAREQKDVDELEQFSLQSIWRSLRGDRQEALSDEQRQLLHARARHDEAVALLKETQLQRGSAQQSVAQLASAPDDYEKLLVQVEAELKRSGGAEGKRLVLIEARLNELGDAEGEVSEVQSAARAADAALAIVMDRLQSARNWGALDMWGGGTITTAIKYEHIDEARSALAFAQAKLKDLERELGDLERLKAAQIEIGPFATLADYVLDTLIVDWFVQARIVEARERLGATLASIHLIEGDLHERVRRLNREQVELETERLRILGGGADSRTQRPGA